MSEKKVEIVRTASAAFDRGDIDAVLRLCADDIVITQPPELPGVSPEQYGHRGSWRPSRSGQNSGRTIASRS
jgi:ketosteroid isomerase-like protein